MTIIFDWVVEVADCIIFFYLFIFFVDFVRSLLLRLSMVSWSCTFVLAMTKWKNRGFGVWVLFFLVWLFGVFSPLSLKMKKRESGRKKEEMAPAGGDGSIHLGSLFAGEGGSGLDPRAWSLASSTSLSQADFNSNSIDSGNGIWQVGWFTGRWVWWVIGGGSATPMSQYVVASHPYFF